MGGLKRGWWKCYVILPFSQCGFIICFLLLSFVYLLDRSKMPEMSYGSTHILHVKPPIALTFSGLPGAVHWEQAGPNAELLFSVPKKGLVTFHAVLLTGAWHHLWLPQSHWPTWALPLCQHTQHLPFRQWEHGMTSAERRRTMSWHCSHGTRSHVLYEKSRKSLPTAFEMLQPLSLSDMALPTSKLMSDFKMFYDLSLHLVMTPLRCTCL